MMQVSTVIWFINSKEDAPISVKKQSSRSFKVTLGSELKWSAMFRG